MIYKNIFKKKLYNKKLINLINLFNYKMATIKKNNSKSSRSNIILLDIEGNCSEHLQKTEEWFLKCINKLEKQNKISKLGDCRFTINILSKDFFGLNNKKEKIIILLQNGDNTGPLLESVFDIDNIVLLNESTNDNYISSSDILKILINEPQFINKIGVSSLSKKCMGQFWDDMTTSYPLVFKTPINNIMFVYENSEWIKKPLSNSYGINSFDFN